MTSTKLRSVIASLALVAFAFALAGCGADYDRMDLTIGKTSPLGGGINYARVAVPVGMIVTAHIVPYDDNNDKMNAQLRAVDTNVVEVTNVVSDYDFAFIGLHAGTTDVEVRANGKVVLILTAIVTDQPSPP